ncbi:hypothetical protein JOM56_014436 [Amanita muscaria]
MALPIYAYIVIAVVVLAILAGALRQRRVWYGRPVPVALGTNRVVRVEYQEARAVPLMARMAMPQPVYTPGPGYYPNPGWLLALVALADRLTCSNNRPVTFPHANQYWHW